MRPLFRARPYDKMSAKENNNTLQALAAELVERLARKGYTLATAESCTGGSVAAAVTGVPGSSAVFKGSVVAYCNSVKATVLGVSELTLQQHGAVSESTVQQMAAGAQRVMQAHCSVATSGVAGPSGGTPEKPVGTVWVAARVGDCEVTRLLQLNDEGRARNIEKTVQEVLLLLSEMLA